MNGKTQGLGTDWLTPAVQLASSGLSSAVCSPHSGWMWQAAKQAESACVIKQTLCSAFFSVTEGEYITCWNSHRCGGSSCLWRTSHNSEFPTIKPLWAAGTVVLSCNFARAEVTSHAPPTPSLASPHMIYQIRGLGRGGKQMQERTGIPQEWTVTFSVMLGSLAKWESGQRFFCRFLQDTSWQLFKQ